MPKLISSATRKIFLPSTEGLPEEEKAWVEVKTRLTGGDMLAAATGGNDDIERTEAAIAAFIVDWNFTNEEGETEPITRQSVHQLEIDDFSLLAIEVQKAQKSVDTTIEGEQKKTSSSILTPSIPGVNPT